MNLTNKKILVTGGTGFLGKTLIPLLEKRNAEIITFGSKEYDLRKEQEVKKLFHKTKPEIVIHLATDCGGSKYMKKNSGSIFYNNLMMNTLIQEYSRLNNIEKFVGIGSVASYPEFSKSPIKEDNLWDGYPEDIQASYGLSKKMMLIQSQTYKKQYKFNAIHLIPTNLYGPNYEFDSKNMKIIPIFIKEIVKAKKENKKKINFSGTKNATREFLYVKDCAEAIIKATESYNNPMPVNIGFGKNIKIKELAEKIKTIIGFEGDIIWNTKYSEQHQRKILDINRAEKEFGFKAKISLDEGLKKTINWYLRNNY